MEYKSDTLVILLDSPHKVKRRLHSFNIQLYQNINMDLSGPESTANINQLASWMITSDSVKVILDHRYTASLPPPPPTPQTCASHPANYY